MVSDLKRSLSFYEAVLGYRVVDRHRYPGTELVYMRAPEGGFEIELIETEAPGASPRVQTPLWHLAFGIEDLDREYRRLHGMGLRLDPISDYVANDTFQTRFFYVYDPDGNQIEFLEARGRYARQER
jgi:catechol 2,3-dioxygenase-like lactoylglutathione lyase family enzyme